MADMLTTYNDVVFSKIPGLSLVQLVRENGITVDELADDKVLEYLHMYLSKYGDDDTMTPYTFFIKEHYTRFWSADLKALDNYYDCETDIENQKVIITIMKNYIMEAVNLYETIRATFDAEIFRRFLAFKM